MCNEYIDLGVDCFRIDSGKQLHFNFYDRVFSHIKPHRKDCNITEVLDCTNDLCNYYSQFMLVLTNNTGLDHNKIITFASSHDSDLNNNDCGWTKNISEDVIVRDYYELCKRYPNTIFYARMTKDKENRKVFSGKWKSNIIKEANKFYI